MGVTYEQRVEAGRLARQKVDAMRLEAIEDAGGTFQALARELVAIATSRIDDYVEIAEGGELQAIALDNIDPNKIPAIKKVREKTNIVEKGDAIFKRSQVEYELYDKLDAIKYLCKLRNDEPATKHEVDQDINVIVMDYSKAIDGD